MSQDQITVTRQQLNAIVASALDTALAAVLESDTIASEPKAQPIAVVNAKSAAKVQKNSRKRQKAATKVAPAPKVVAKHYDDTKPKNADGYVTGLLAKSGTSYLLIDKVANRHTQCNVIGCRVLRKGRSRFCKAHHSENGKNMFAKNGVTLNETKR